MLSDPFLLIWSLCAGIPDAGAGHSGVAMAENEDRLEANPALLGSDPYDRSLHVRLTVLETGLPLQTWGTLKPHASLILHGDAERILTSKPFLDDLWKLDGKPVSVHNSWSLAAWKGDWAFSSRVEFHPGARLDHGIVIPSVEAWDSTSIQFRGAVSQPFGTWRLATGLVVRGQAGSIERASLRDPTRLGDEIKALRDSALVHFQASGHWSAGLDLGILQSPTTEIQWGARLGGLGLTNQRNKLETPEFDAGLAWIPSLLHQGPRWGSRLALGLELRDLLDTDVPAMGHLDAGCMFRQNLTPRGIEVRSSVGLRGGWPSAGLGFTLGPFLMDGAAWVEDLDPVLGRTPLQHWDIRAQLGW